MRKEALLELPLAAVGEKTGKFEMRKYFWF